MSEKRKYKIDFIKGSARQIDFAQGSLINVSILKDDVAKMIEKPAKSGAIYLNFTIGTKKDGADEYGNTHNVYVSIPEDEAGSASSGGSVEKTSTGDVPF